MPADADHKPKQLYEFGPFRVDAEKELLLRGQETVPLTPKTFQILLVLVRHSQELVTKDDLMKMVWPDTFVEEANLSRNIFLLRKALGESPQDHHYVVTVPGRGYRFAEDVRLVPEQELNIVAASHTKVQVDVREIKPWLWISVAAVLLIALGIGAFRLVGRRPPLTAKDTLVLADFANSTGDPIFDETLRQGLSVQLEQSPFLSLIPDQRVRKTLELMGQGADANLGPEVARQVCERTGSAAVVEGSIGKLGSDYVIGLRARSCGSGEILDDEQSQVSRKEDVLKALDRIASSLRGRLGESLVSVEKYSTPLDEATTPSLEALKAYSTGVKLGFSSGWASGIPSLKRATEIDPNFAMAYAHLGLWYNSVGEPALAVESNTRAYQLRQRATDRERFFISTMYKRNVAGNLESELQELRLWEQTYPRDVYVHGLLSGFGSQGTGRYEQSIDEAKKALALDPEFTPADINLAFSYFYLDRLDEARRVIDQALARKVNVPEILLLNFYLALLDGDEQKMNRAADLAKGVSGAEDWMVFSRALVLACSGRLQAASETTQRAMELARQSGRLERAATYETGEADWEALVGNGDSAKKLATQALKLSSGRDVKYAAAFALALAGDNSRARTIANDLARQFPEDTAVQFNYLPALRGLIALRAGSAAQAIEALRAAEPYELAMPPIAFNTFFGALYPVWVRGEAYRAAHQPTKAATEFQKILDRRGIVQGDPIGTLARLELGRAYAASGERDKARAAYGQFFHDWRASDAEVPILKHARSEYARL